MLEIKGFQGQYRFLSNFYPYELDFEGRHYLNSEAAYQASKSSCDNIKNGFTTIDARAARRVGRQITIRSDWEQDKLNVMYRILRAKFAQEPMRGRLLSTDDAYLEETNYWKDTFWGVYMGVGENHLGKLLMLVRDEIKEGII